MLTADCLLAGDVGRPDFNGDAAAQYLSVQRHLGLPDRVSVLPGHFERPCGKSMSGEPSTTIGYEREFNPMTRLDHDALVSALVAEVPARPLNMVALEATNRSTRDLSWAMLTSQPHIAEVDIDGLATHLGQVMLLDVREPDEYAAGHVPGAIRVPQAELALHVEGLPRDRPVYVICRAGTRSRRATQLLAQCGYGQVTNVFDGTDAWRAAGKAVV